MALLQAKEVGDIRDDMGIVFVLDNQLPRSRFCHFHRCFCRLPPPLSLVLRRTIKTWTQLLLYNKKADLYKGSARLIKLWLNKQLLSSGALFHSPTKDFFLHPEQKSKLCL